MIRWTGLAPWEFEFPSPAKQVQSNAAGALHNLAVNDEEAQEAVAAAGAIPPLIALMQNASPDLQVRTNFCQKLVEINPPEK